VSIAVLTMTVLLLSAGSAWAATYYSQGSLDPNVTTNWNSIRLGGGSSPANFTSGDVFAIQASHSMATTAAWTVSGAGSKVQIESGGTLTANHIVAIPTFQVDDGASYIHNAASGTSNGVASALPGSTTRTFGSASTVEIRKWANGGTVPVALPNVTWGNLTLNLTTLAGDWNQLGALQTVNGNLTVQATGGFAFDLQSSGTTTATVGGNYAQSGGTLVLATVTGANVTLNVSGNMNIIGGTLSFTTANNITSALNLSGDLSVTGSGTMTESGNKKPAVTFQKAGTQVFTSGGTVSGAPDFTVNAGSTLDLGTSILTGGSFTLSSGAGLIVGSAAGITTTGATGNIQVSGARTYSTTADYTYNG